MDKFNESHRLPKLINGEIENLKSSVSIKEIEFAIKKSLPTQKTTGPHNLTCEFYQTFKKEMILT